MKLYQNIDSGGANNYIPFLYSYLKLNTYTHLDKLTFSIYYQCNTTADHLLFSALHNLGYRCDADKWLVKGKYRRQRIYMHGNSKAKIHILYQCDCAYMPPMFAIIHDPDIETVDDIDALLNSLGFETKISQIEMAIDFYTHIEILKKFFSDHLFLPYHRKGCCTFGDDQPTYYIGDTRKQSKAIRLYPKPIDGREALRLELVLNRPTIEKLGLALPLDNIAKIDLTKFLCFKQLNKEKLFNSMLPKYKQYFSKKDSNSSLRGKVRLSVERSWIIRAPTLIKKVVPLCL